MASEFTWQNISRTSRAVCVSIVSLVCILPDSRLWYGFQIGRDLDALLPLLSPGVREHVEVVRAELSRVRQLHGRDEVGTEHLRRGEGSERRVEGREESGQNQNHTRTYLFYRANSTWKLHFNNSLTIFLILYNAERRRMRDFMRSQWLEQRLRSNFHPKRRLCADKSKITRFEEITKRSNPCDRSDAFISEGGSFRCCGWHLESSPDFTHFFPVLFLVTFYM